MTKLYELSDAMLRIRDYLLDDEENTIYQDALDNLDEEFEEKADGIAKIRAEIKGDIASLSSEIERLQNKKKALENKEKSLMDYLESEMRKTGKIKFKTNLFSYGIQKSTPSLQIEYEDIVPEQFWETKRTIKKSALAQAVKDGLELDGVYFQQGEHLRIR